MRLIDAVKLKQYIQSRSSHALNEWSTLGVYAAIDSQPTVEAEPIVHGSFIGTEYDGYADGNPVYYLWECSNCHEEFGTDGEPPICKYCPYCGAKMDGKEIEE